MAAERHDYVYMGGGRDTVPPEATHVSVHESINVIPARLFQGHGNIIVELICHIGVTKIEEGAFEGCFRLERAIMPGVVEVESAAFYSCSVHTIECDRLEIIGIFAFDQAQLESIDLPSARIVRKEAFRECDLVDVKFGKNLESIGERAFSDTALKRITIPLKNGLFPHDDPDNDVFIGCESLSQVFLVEETIDDALINAVGSLILPDEQRNHIVNKEVDSINQFLPSVLAGEWDDEREHCEIEGEKGKVIQEWITRAKQKIIDEYKDELSRFLSLAAIEIAHASPNEIVIDSVLSFLQLPGHEFEGEGYLTSPPFDRQLWENVVQMKQRLLEKDAEIASLKQRVAYLELQSTEGSEELAKIDAGWLPEKRQRGSS